MNCISLYTCTKEENDRNISVTRTMVKEKLVCGVRQIHSVVKGGATPAAR